MAEYNFRKAADEDQKSITSIYNYYVENSLAAYFENPFGNELYFRLKQLASGFPFYVIESMENVHKPVIGFGLIHKYHPAKAFEHTAELTYFIHPDHTRSGLGTRLLDILVKEAKSMGINTLLASISSANQASQDFHLKNGFHQCGRFENIGRKFGQSFDIVWMQKNI